MAYEAPCYMRRIAKFTDSQWDLFVAVRRDGRTWHVEINLGFGGSILRKGMSKRAAIAYADTVVMTPVHESAEVSA